MAMTPLRHDAPAWTPGLKSSAPIDVPSSAADADGLPEDPWALSEASVEVFAEIDAGAAWGSATGTLTAFPGPTAPRTPLRERVGAGRGFWGFAVEPLGSR